MDDLIAAAAEGNPEITQFECSVFNGEYITDDVDEVYLKRLENIRSDAAKSLKKNGGSAVEPNLVADLHNDA